MLNCEPATTMPKLSSTGWIARSLIPEMLWSKDVPSGLPDSVVADQGAVARSRVEGDDLSVRLDGNAGNEPNPRRRPPLYSNRNQSPAA